MKITVGHNARAVIFGAVGNSSTLKKTSYKNSASKPSSTSNKKESNSASQNQLGIKNKSPTTNKNLPSLKNQTLCKTNPTPYFLSYNYRTFFYR